MRAYIIRRLMVALPVIFGVVTMVFLIVHLTPGDPVEIMLGESAAVADRETLRRELGLDRPLVEQYAAFLGGVATFDLGKSLYTKKGVFASIRDKYPATLILALCSMAVAVAIAIPMGALAAAKKDTWVDRGSMFMSLIGVSMPSFWLGPLLILIFAVEFKWLPVSGMDSPASIILPALTLGSAMAAILSRLTRSTMIEALGEDFISTARAKGVKERAVLFRHALANALLPVTTVAGLQLGAMLAGAVITETIFAWPGLGRLTIQAINARDYPLIQGCVLTIAVSYVLVNLLVDVMYAVIDPRVRRR
ncbi:MAG: ABC transporter permease [Nitrospinae bacterium]|nr:ABC transporter permease [Nitrospinota bacterium]